MIKLVRIDDRLVHGQVAFTWIPSLSADFLLVANDKAAKDEFMKMTLGLAKPPNTRLAVKSISDAITILNDDKYKALKMLVLVNSVPAAHALAIGVPTIQSINFGGIRTNEGSHAISKAVSVNESDIVLIRELVEKGVELEIRQVPTDTRQFVKDLI